MHLYDSAQLRAKVCLEESPRVQKARERLGGGGRLDHHNNFSGLRLHAKAAATGGLLL